MIITYKELKERVQKANIKTQTEYVARYKELAQDDGKKIPSNPNLRYQEMGWVNWYSFLGTENALKKDFLSFEEAKKAVKANNISTQQDYHSRYREVKGLPSAPYLAYKNEWQGFQDFFGIEREYMSYDEAKVFIQKHNIATQQEYKKRYKEISDSLSSDPRRIYGKSWKGWGDFLSAGRGRYATLTEARKIVRQNKIKNVRQYQKFCSTYNKTAEKKLYTNPNVSYKRISSWDEFFK